MNTVTERTKEAMLEKMQKMNKENSLNPDKKKLAVMCFRNAQKTGNKIFLYIPLELLKVDHEMYQRPLQSHVRTIAKNWDDDKCDPLMVNYRNDGFFYVIDGQHRYEAAVMRGLEGIVCVVFVGLTIREEADMFTEQNEVTKKLTPYDTYKANICRGQETDCQIKEVCDKYGVKVEKSNTIKVLKSVTTAREIVLRQCKENLDWIFDLFKDTGWDAYKKTYTDGFMHSLNNVQIYYEDQLVTAREKLVKFMEKTTPEAVQALAHKDYPNMGRTSALNKIFGKIIEENLDVTTSDDGKVIYLERRAVQQAYNLNLHT